MMNDEVPNLWLKPVIFRVQKPNAMPKRSNDDDPRDDRRSFYWGCEACLFYMLKQAVIKPLPMQQVKMRPTGGSGKYKLLGGKQHEFQLYESVSGYRVFCAPKALKDVYRAFVAAKKHLESMHEVRQIIQPILPQRVVDLIQETVFDFYQAINDLKTTRGFGNVGIILTGPPGVGKTETMRWVGEVCQEKYDRGNFSLSLVELQKILANGMPINTNQALIFVDDIDASLLKDRRETQNPLASQFLSCLDGLSKREGRVIIVSTNERIDKVDPALTRPGRFEHTIHFDYPTPDLVDEFCTKRKIEIPSNLFYGWSFARIDLFLAKFKVSHHRYKTPLNVYYEKFIHDMGEEDPTVAAIQAQKDKDYDEN